MMQKTNAYHDREQGTYWFAPCVSFHVAFNKTKTNAEMKIKQLTKQKQKEHVLHMVFRHLLKYFHVIRIALE